MTEVAQRFTQLTTPLVSDAALRLGIPLRMAPAGLLPVHATARRVAGRVAAALHRGSVDVFLEAIGRAGPGDVLVIDNEGRRNEACIGDLTALEAWSAGLGGMLVWGFHRDTAELQQIALPVFSYGAYPGGPQRLDPPSTRALTFGDVPFSGEDFVFVDEDGAVFIDGARVSEVLDAAEKIATTERRQAAMIREGRSLHAQLRFDEYLAAREQDPTYTLRKHLVAIGGAIEV
jgi:regulator of RNase E activity RraA